MSAPPGVIDLHVDHVDLALVRESLCLWRASIQSGDMSRLADEPRALYKRSDTFLDRVCHALAAFEHEARATEARSRAQSTQLRGGSLDP